MEKFALPGVGGIIEKKINGKSCILVQRRCKDIQSSEYGLIEIPAGKIREFENIYDCLRREIFEETGLKVTTIEGELQSQSLEMNGYQVLNYEPFSCAQNLKGTYPIMVQIFICEAEGVLSEKSDEAQNIMWMELDALKNLLENDAIKLYPMHIHTLNKYLKHKKGR